VTAQELAQEAADTRVTVLPGRTAPTRAADGREVYTGRGESASITLPRATGRAWTVAVWSRDTSGNVRVTTLTVHPR
jgi:hypothetical protein